MIASHRGWLQKRLSRSLRPLKTFATSLGQRLEISNDRKFFCIGHNKTGTTSLKKAFEDLGYVVGEQNAAEALLHEYRDRRFVRIVEYCQSAEVFQDIPFSLPYLYVHLDQVFPNSKFILTLRDSEDQWYESLIRHQARAYGDGSLPSMPVLKAADYCWKGFAYETKRIIYNTPDSDLYNKERMVRFYNHHNSAILEYFRYRPGDLLVINLREPDAYQKFCTFIGEKPIYDKFPWENASEQLSR